MIPSIETRRDTFAPNVDNPLNQIRASSSGFPPLL